MKISSLKPQPILTSWTTEQDCFLIENSFLSIEELRVHLPYTEDEIRVRKSVLGLVRRQRQMNRM
ncbi:hypothetical protein [Acinetobacter proteolyticus]|uniref:hypothetical protein n=1 Tax=Acinetobacter proteolyticus TaxID=1776741 RepID=UPI0031D73EA4